MYTRKPRRSQTLQPRVTPPRQRRSLRSFVQRSLISLVLCFLCALIFPLTLAQLSVSQPNSIAQLTPAQLINQAKTAYQSQQFEQSAILWQQTANAFAKTGDALNQAMALSNLSLTHQQLGRWTEAKAAIDRSLSMVQAQPKSPDQQRILAASLDIQGQMNLAIGQPDAALKTWQQSANFYKALKQTDAYNRAQINQAQALQNLGLYPKACQTLLAALDVDSQSCQLPRQTLATLGSQPTTPLQLVGLRSLGDVLRILGQMDQSQSILLLAVEKEVQLPKENNQIGSSRSVSLGNIYVSLGNTARALGNRTLQISPNPQPISINLTQGSCNQLPVQGKAEQYYQQAIACYQQAATTPDPAVQIQANLNQLSLLIETQQWPLVATLLPQIQSTLDTLPANHTTLSAQLKWAQIQMCLKARESGSQLETSMNGMKVAYAGSPLPIPPLRKGREPNLNLAVPPSVLTQSSKSSSTLAVPPSPSEGEGLGVRSAMQSTPPLLTQCRALPTVASAQQSSLPAILIPNKLQIHQTVTTAYRQAQLLSDHRSEADALGYLGARAFQSGSLPDAQRLTEQALQQVSTYDAPDIAYRWLWQLGRIHHQQGHAQEAIAAYRAAFNILKSLRGDLVAMNPDVQFTFREEVEPIYRELVSLLLADAKPNEKALQEARDVIESLQLAELNNFFQQACLEARPQPIDQIDPKAAVLYSIILNDRLAVITSIPGQPLQYNTVSLAAAPSSSPSQKNVLDRTVEDLEATLNPFITSPEPLQPSQQLYNWLIRPVEPELVRNEIKTLVFVMDGVLRRVPLAALHDGQQYLVEKYNVALTPGLQLLTPRSTQTKSLKTLVGGLVASRQGFPPLPAVQQEVQEISSILPTQVLLDDEFTRDRLQQNIENTTYPVVHLATHAQFSSRAENTFLLTWDERINVRSLDQFLRQRERRLTKNPIELLILSACQTAAGDNRATLGLAGVAVRSGARSTVATLWSVQDQSTADLMAQFYAALDKPGVSKAAALRQAQLSLLRSPQVQYHHPYYWAAFILIGNWL
jgi:CHAT domain-containing protein